MREPLPVCAHDLVGEPARHHLVVKSFGQRLSFFSRADRPRYPSPWREMRAGPAQDAPAPPFLPGLMQAGCAETFDSILGGAVRVIQPRAGYRFSVDAVLLARFATVRPQERVLELGAGCGVVSLIIAELGRPSEVCAVEIQPELAQLVARNAALNGLRNLHALCCDLRQSQIAGLKAASFDLVVANPPYHAPHSGRESPNPSRQLARGGAGAKAEEFLAAASRYARHAGRVALVFSAGRAAELIALMRSMGLEPKRIRFVHPRLDLPASSILIEARKGGGIKAKIEPPLILYKDKGIYSEEAAGLLTRP